MDSKFLLDCEFCGLRYCGNCSDASQYDRFCSMRCEDAHEKDNVWRDL